MGISRSLITVGSRLVYFGRTAIRFTNICSSLFNARLRKDFQSFALPRLAPVPGSLSVASDLLVSIIAFGADIIHGLERGSKKIVLSQTQVMIGYFSDGELCHYYKYSYLFINERQNYLLVWYYFTRGCPYINSGENLVLCKVHILYNGCMLSGRKINPTVLTPFVFGKLYTYSVLPIWKFQNIITVQMLRKPE